MTAAGILIIGAGQAGFQVAASLREYGYADPITLVGDEGMLPYQRPPLSKAYLLGELEAERLQLRPQSFFTGRGIALVLGDPAVAIDRAGRRVSFASGASRAYDHLVLAVGARNRRLPVEGANRDGVFYLRTCAEADAIHGRLLAAQGIVVVGAGFIGLELAAVASKLGKRVCVIEALGRVMSRAVTAPLSDFYAKAHAGWGVELLLNTRLQAVTGSGGCVTGVVLADGREIAAELVLVGIGIEPNVELAAAAGLATANGIVVDASLATADPRISAVGDCAAFPGGGALIRLESVQNAVDQGRCVAKRIAGEGEDYDALPWFWSDQRDLKLQMVGLTGGCDQTVLRGDPEARAFSVFCFRDGRLIGIESVNRPAEHIFGRRLLSAGETIRPDQAADPAFDLKARLAQLPPPQRRR